MFGALINLTVRVDTYFHPIRMTYPIHPESFLGSTKLGKSRQTLSFSELFRTAAASRHNEESHLIYGPLESILLDQGFPVDYVLDEFNPPQTGTTSKSPSTLATSTVTQNSAQTSSHFIPGQHFLETFMLLSPTTMTTHSWTMTTFLSSTSKHDFCYTYGDHISLIFSNALTERRIFHSGK